LKGFGKEEEPEFGEKHVCPKCGEKTLELMNVGMWD
jgi:ribosomal protein L37AE/L43A